MGNAAFFEPCTVILPRSGLPPIIRIASNPRTPRYLLTYYLMQKEVFGDGSRIKPAPFLPAETAQKFLRN